MALAATDVRVQQVLGARSATAELFAYAKEALDRNEVDLGARLAVLANAMQAASA